MIERGGGGRLSEPFRMLFWHGGKWESSRFEKIKPLWCILMYFAILFHTWTICKYHTHICSRYIFYLSHLFIVRFVSYALSYSSIHENLMHFSTIKSGLIDVSWINDVLAKQTETSNSIDWSACKFFLQKTVTSKHAKTNNSNEYFN